MCLPGCCSCMMPKQHVSCFVATFTCHSVDYGPLHQSTFPTHALCRCWLAWYALSLSCLPLVDPLLLPLHLDICSCCVPAQQGPTLTSYMLSCGSSSRRCSVQSHAVAATAASRRLWCARAISRRQGFSPTRFGRCLQEPPNNTSSSCSRYVPGESHLPLGPPFVAVKH